MSVNNLDGFPGLEDVDLSQPVSLNSLKTYQGRKEERVAQIKAEIELLTASYEAGELGDFSYEDQLAALNTQLKHMEVRALVTERVITQIESGEKRVKTPRPATPARGTERWMLQGLNEPTTVNWYGGDEEYTELSDLESHYSDWIQEGNDRMAA